MKKLLLISACLLCFFSCTQKEEYVTISGYVADYDGNPLDSVSVGWMDPQFKGNIFEALTDRNGYYSARIKKGRYYSMAALNMSKYPHIKFPLSEEDQRLEFWAWNFIADRDTTYNISYHRMEAYGINVFRIRGGTPAYTIYVRPMSLTRAQTWMKNKIPEEFLAPSPENAKVIVTVDGEEVPINMIQEVKEYFDETAYGNAYLISVGLPEKKNPLPYHIFKIYIEDKENGDKGEGVYFLEKLAFESSHE